MNVPACRHSSSIAKNAVAPCGYPTFSLLSGRGWALWKALLMIAEELEGRGDGRDVARRFGWRHTPRQIVDVVIAETTGRRPSDG